MSRKIKHPDGTTLNKSASFKSTPVSDKEPAVIKTLPPKRAIVFFIGGAGDKESFYSQGPNYNIVDAQNIFLKTISGTPVAEKITSPYLGYYEVYSETNVEKNVLPLIPDKENPVYIVGHSLGGWNGAWLSGILAGKGYSIPMLITLDPVGNGFGVELIANIPTKKPVAKTNYWINLLAKPEKSDFSDVIADFGERWIPSNPSPNIHAIANINHLYADKLFTVKIGNSGLSAMDYMIRHLNENI